MFIELLARNPRLHGAVKILFTHSQNLVHAGGVDTNTAPRGCDLPLHSCARAVGNNRHTKLVAYGQYGRNFIGALNEAHGIGRLAIVPGFVVTVLLADRCLGGKPFANYIGYGLQGCCQVGIDCQNLQEKGDLFYVCRLFFKVIDGSWPYRSR